MTKILQSTLRLIFNDDAGNLMKVVAVKNVSHWLIRLYLVARNLEWLINYQLCLLSFFSFCQDIFSLSVRWLAWETWEKGTHKLRRRAFGCDDSGGKKSHDNVSHKLNRNQIQNDLAKTEIKKNGNTTQQNLLFLLNLLLLKKKAIVSSLSPTLKVLAWRNCVFSSFFPLRVFNSLIIIFFLTRRKKAKWYRKQTMRTNTLILPEREREREREKRKLLYV